MTLTPTLTRYRLFAPRPLVVRDDPPPPPPKLGDLLKQHPTIQTDIDSMIENRLAEDRRRRGPNTDPDKDRELEELRREKAERARKDEEAKGNYERALGSVKDEFEGEKQKWSKAESKLLDEIKHDRCYSQLVVEATSAGAINAEDVAGLLNHRLTLDDDRKVVVLGDDGKPWLKAGTNVTVKALIERHKHDRPHLYKADEGGGEGSGAAGTGQEGGDGNTDTLTGLDAQIDKAQKDYDAAHAKASKSGSLADLQASKAARRTLEELKDKKAKKKSA